MGRGGKGPVKGQNGGPLGLWSLEEWGATRLRASQPHRREGRDESYGSGLTLEGRVRA